MFRLISSLVCGVFLASCAPSTPQARIAASPRAFAMLSRKEKILVADGQLARGMSRAAVELAWGPPSQTYEGMQKGQTTERWDFSASRPVYSTNFYSGFGFSSLGGYSRYGRGSRYGRYSSLGIGQEVSYVPYRVASVWFVDQQVDSWERSR